MAIDMEYKKSSLMKDVCIFIFLIIPPFVINGYSYDTDGYFEDMYGDLHV